MEDRKINNNICAHHWIIEPEKNGISKAKCKLCEETKDFNNNDNNNWRVYNWHARPFKFGTRRKPKV